MQVMKNSALSAKVHAMRGKSLKDNDYDTMMHMTTVSDVASYLMDKTRYKRALVGISPAHIHRGALEQRLREDLNNDIRSLIPYMSYGGKRFMELTEIEEGITILKICCRLLYSGHFKEVPEYIEKLKATGTVDNFINGEITSIDMLIDCLYNTPYFTPLKVFKGNKEKQQPFYMEMRLDSYWTKLVFKFINKYLSNDEKKSVKKLYGTEFDIENLTFILRCKKSFDMSDEEIYTCLFPYYYRIKDETIKSIVNAPTYDAALEIIKADTPYGVAFSGNDRFMEKREKEYLLRIIARAYNNLQYSVLSAIDYVYLRRSEIENIISITEGIRYGLPPEKIKGYLIKKAVQEVG